MGQEDGLSQADQRARQAAGEEWRCLLPLLKAPRFRLLTCARLNSRLSGLIIDARAKGNIARLLNSSCDPNCEAQKWHDAANGEIRVGIFALRDIHPGEELTYDYQFQHFGLAGEAARAWVGCGAGSVARWRVAARRVLRSPALMPVPRASPPRPPTAAAASAYRCKCGAPNCRGTMDTQPERTKDFGRRVEVYWPGDKVWYAGTVTGYSTAAQR